MSAPHTRETARPSQFKINAMRNACDRCGYSGLHDPKFVAFVRRLVGVDHPRFITDLQASVVLVEMILVNLMGESTREFPTPGAHEGA